MKKNNNLENTKILAVIPARGGSKSIKNKNIVKVKDRPLIEFTANAAKKSKYINKVIVSTDDIKIKKISERLNLDVPFKRPKFLSTDRATTHEVIKHAVNNYERIINCSFEIIVTLQPTSPLRTSKHIDESIEKFISDKTSDSLISVQEVPHNFIPDSIMKIDEYGYINNYKKNQKRLVRRQDKAKFYARNGPAICITKRKKLEKYLYGGKISHYIMDYFSSLDIDTPKDLELLNKFIK